MAGRLGCMVSYTQVLHELFQAPDLSLKYDETLPEFVMMLQDQLMDALQAFMVAHKNLEQTLNSIETFVIPLIKKDLETESRIYTTGIPTGYAFERVDQLSTYYTDYVDSVSKVNKLVSLFRAWKEFDANEVEA